MKNRILIIAAVTICAAIAAAPTISQIADKFRQKYNTEPGEAPLAVTARGLFESPASSGRIQVYDDDTQSWRDANATDIFGGDSPTSTDAGATITGDLTLRSDITGGNLGAKNVFTGVINAKLIPFATMTNGTATVKTRTLMDDTPAAEFSAVTVTAPPVDTQDATFARKGTNSLKLAWPSTSVAGDGIQWTAFSAENWEAQESVGFWVYSTDALTAGDLTFVTVDSTGDVAFNIPAVAANIWTWVEVNISGLTGGTGDAVTNYKILLSTAGAAAHGVFDTYFDGGWKWDATEELTLGVDLVDSPGSVSSVLAVVKANTGTHDLAALAEDTDFFVHYESGNDFLVTITDQSANSAFALVYHK